MLVQAVPLWPGVSLTLIHDGGAWRFASWSCCLDEAELPPPAASELDKRFTRFEDAAEHFRRLCPRDRLADAEYSTPVAPAGCVDPRSHTIH